MDITFLSLLLNNPSLNMKFAAAALFLSSLASFVFADDETAGVSITNPVLNVKAALI